MIIQQCRRTITKRSLVNKHNFLSFINFKIVRIMLINLVFNNSSNNNVFKAIISIKISIKNFTTQTIAIRHSKISNVNRRYQTSLINNETRSIFNHCNRTIIFLLTLISALIIVFINLIFNRIINRSRTAIFLINNSGFITTRITIKRIITKKNIKKFMKIKISKIKITKRKHIRKRMNRTNRTILLISSRKHVIIL